MSRFLFTLLGVHEILLCNIFKTTFYLIPSSQGVGRTHPTHSPSDPPFLGEPPFALLIGEGKGSLL